MKRFLRKPAPEAIDGYPVRRLPPSDPLLPKFCGELVIEIPLEYYYSLKKWHQDLLDLKRILRN